MLSISILKSAYIFKLQSLMIFSEAYFEQKKLLDRD